MEAFFQSDAHEWQPVGDGVKRKVMLWNDEIMAVCVCFAKGAAGTAHAHDIHSQIGYIGAGSFEITVSGEKRVLKKGDCYLAEKNALHGAVALEDDSMIIDVFTPKRDDFLPQ